MVFEMIWTQGNLSTRIIALVLRSVALEIPESWTLLTGGSIASHSLRIILFSRLVKVALSLMIEAIVDQCLVLVRQVRRGKLLTR